MVRGTRPGGLWITWCAGWLTVFAVMAAAQADEAALAAAHVKIRDYHAASGAREAALAQNRGDEAREQETKARAALREAQILLEQAGAANAKDPVVLREYAEVLQLKGDYDLAAETLERAVKFAPADAALWFALGADRMKIGPKWRLDALTALRKSLDLEDAGVNAAKTWSLLGDLYWAEGLFDTAREHYDQALKLAPDDVWTKIALAAANIRDARMLEGSKTLDDLGKAAQPFDVQTRERLREALQGFDAARRWFPDTAENHAAYARVLYRAARFPEAVLAARRAARMNPADFATWNFIAAMQLQLGNLEKAQEAYQKSLEANTEQPQVREALDRIQAESKKLPTPDKPLIMRQP